MIKILDSLYSTLTNYSASRSNAKKEVLWFIGYTLNNITHLLSCVACTNISEVNNKGEIEIDILKEQEHIRNTLPGGLDIVGFYLFNIEFSRKQDDCVELNNVLTKINTQNNILNSGLSLYVIGKVHTPHTSAHATT